MSKAGIALKTDKVNYHENNDKQFCEYEHERTRIQNAIAAGICY